MDTNQGEGSFKLLRSFLGTIAGGLSSLASLPFGKRKKPEDALPLDTSPHPRTGLDQRGDELRNLYPDMELSETRKRARLSLDEVFEDTVEYSTGKEDNCLDRKCMGESTQTGLCETRYGFERSPSELDVHYGVDEILDDVDSTALSSDGVPHASHGEIETERNTIASVDKGVSELDEALLGMGEDSDDFLASFRRTLVARKAKEQKRVRYVSKEESPRKKVRFGESTLGDNEPSESSPGQSKNSMFKIGTRSTKPKGVDVTEGKNERKLRALTLNEEPVRPEGRTSTVGMASILTRKRERVDDDTKTAAEEVKLQKEKANKRSKSIVETEKIANRQGARVVYRDELVARAALAHNMKEFNGSRLRVSAAHTHESKEEVSGLVDDSWSIFVSNTPTDVKDEELHDVFRSLKVDVTGVRVIRDAHTDLSKGTAYVFFKTAADVNRLLSSRHTFRLRGRVLRVSRALANNQAEQRPKQSRSTKRSIIPDTDDSMSQKKRVKMSLLDETDTSIKELGQAGEQILTRSRRGGTESAKQHINVPVSSPHVYATRQVAATLGPLEISEESPEKRKRVEKRQRGISRSKKIRRT